MKTLKMTLSYIFDITLMLIIVILFAGVVGKNFLLEQSGVNLEADYNDYSASIINAFLMTTLSNYPNAAIPYYEN